MKTVYLIWIWGIWVSAIARYYLSMWYKVLWSDKTNSELIEKLKSEWCEIHIWENSEKITTDIELLIYSEAIPSTNSELQKAKELWIEIKKYNEALWYIANNSKLIAITGTHGKSTTSSLVSLILKNSGEKFFSVVGTVLREFDEKNFYTNVTEKKPDDYFCIEACEYKEHFLVYRPTVLVITNIEYDHADYFKTEDDYINAFKKAVQNVVPWWFIIYDINDTHSKELLEIRSDITYIWVNWDTYTFDGESFKFPQITLQVPGDHILYDAKLAYVVGHMLWVWDESILETLKNYTWVWRRMEVIWKTKNWNILMSDYGHHPTEILVTTKALKEKYSDKKLYCVFQPHQYSRTLELLDDFKTCFSYCDTLIIPNIYASRDSIEDMEKISAEKLVQQVEHPNKFFGDELENTLKMIEDYDVESPNSSIILLQWAGNIDDLRYKIKVKKIGFSN